MSDCINYNTANICGHQAEDHVAEPGEQPSSPCTLCACDDFYPARETEQPMTEKPKQTGTTVAKWVDEAMFSSEPLNAETGPRAYLLQAPADPLGGIAAAAKMYKGEVVRDLAKVTDEERKYYLIEIQKTKLAMPLEAVQLHFMLEGVSRAFTHQLVRQRTAAYAQESMRFAVVEDDWRNRVALPAMLIGTTGAAMKLREEIANSYGYLSKWAIHDDAGRHVSPAWQAWEDGFDRLAKAEQIRYRWDLNVDAMQRGYETMIQDGMPAEDARGLMPTNILTRVHYVTNLRGLLDHAGNRLCTQAQFEWRLVLAAIAKAIAAYGENVDYKTPDSVYPHGLRSSAWQYAELSRLLKPACYQAGRCTFAADFDRKCSIRSRVDANAEMGRPSSEWGNRYVDSERACQEGDDFIEDHGYVHRPAEGRRPVFIGAIGVPEWLADPTAAR